MKNFSFGKSFQKTGLFAKHFFPIFWNQVLCFQYSYIIMYKYFCLSIAYHVPLKNVPETDPKSLWCFPKICSFDDDGNMIQRCLLDFSWHKWSKSKIIADRLKVKIIVIGKHTHNIHTQYISHWYISQLCV